MEEIWKDVIGYEGIYAISNFGNVKSLDRKIYNSVYKKGYAYTKGKYMYKNKDKDGYLTVGFFKDKKMKTFKIHRLVAIHFLEPNNYKTIVNHKNGIKSDNRVENLEWCTNSENLKHAYDTLGIVNKVRKLSEDDVNYIIQNFKHGVNQFDRGTCHILASKFNVSYMTIYNVIKNKTYIKLKQPTK